MRRRMDWNTATDYGKFAAPSEKLAENTRRALFDERYPLSEAGRIPIQATVRRAPSSLRSRANRLLAAARDGGGRSGNGHNDDGRNENEVDSNRRQGDGYDSNGYGNPPPRSN
jgi:hypothetical protein